MKIFIPFANDNPINGAVTLFKSIQHLLVATLLSAVVACGGSGTSTDNSNGSDGSSTTPNNNAPVANAGADQSVATGTLVNLDGSASSDADGDSLSYQWQLSSVPAASSATLTSLNSITTSFTADASGSYVIELIVNDGTEDSNADTVTITATTPGENTVPVASAGADIQLNTGNSITLDGSASSDPEGVSLSYLWTLVSAPDGSSASLDNNTIVSPTFAPDLAGSYQFSLIVNDGELSSSADTVLLNAADWVINNTARSTYITESGQGVLVNVQSVGNTSLSGDDAVEIVTTGIPDYAVVMSQDDIDALNNRPRAASDFNNGSTSASVGETILFGQDIGYNAGNGGPGCSLGYWPPGPECASNQNNSGDLPVRTEAASQSCATGLGKLGFMLNGTAIYNWEDGQSYNQQNSWHNLAPMFEIYDVDICLGHAQREGEYHHHMYSKCLAGLFDDDGSKHSPIYGYAADGYPIYGPWYDNGVLAKSAWVKRDYDDVNSASGCGEAGVRNCQLVDQYDFSKGMVSVSNGPTTSETVTSLSSNQFVTVSGHYFEDYYYDASLTAKGGEYLDQHNGHSHGNLGYHYHTTVEQMNGKLSPAFPYNIGPTFYGKVPNGGLVNCQ